MLAAGLVYAMALAVKTSLDDLTDAWLTLPGYFGANAGLTLTMTDLVTGWTENASIRYNASQ